MFCISDVEYKLFGNSTIIFKDHRTIQWFGLEGAFKTIWSNPPAMGRDTFL